jgi:hypothetical protein
MPVLPIVGIDGLTRREASAPLRITRRRSIPQVLVGGERPEVAVRRDQPPARCLPLHGVLVHRIHQRSPDASSLLERLDRGHLDAIATLDVGEQANTLIAIERDEAREWRGVDQLTDWGTVVVPQPRSSVASVHDRSTSVSDLTNTAAFDDRFRRVPRWSASARTGTSVRGSLTLTRHEVDADGRPSTPLTALAG